jgi:hypothetical protein
MVYLAGGNGPEPGNGGNGGNGNSRMGPPKSL